MNITAGKYKGQKVKAPDEKITRPTLSKIRESVFNTLFSMIVFEGKSFLDMFAGSGIMGLEALSRGFENVTAIEKNPKIANVLKENYANVKIHIQNCPLTPALANISPSPQSSPRSGEEEYQIKYELGRERQANYLIIGDSLKKLPNLNQNFDVIYLDPPYFSGIYEQSLKIIKENFLLKKGGIIVLEHATEVDIQGFELIKKKKYSQKFVTFLSSND